MKYKDKVNGKIVEAKRVIEVFKLPGRTESTYCIKFGGGTQKTALIFGRPAEAGDWYVDGGYYMTNGEFESRYTMEKAEFAGYVKQSSWAVEQVNCNKVQEEEILRVLDALASNDAVDKRWLAIGRTQLEQAFMAINRSIFKPGRVDIKD